MRHERSSKTFNDNVSITVFLLTSSQDILQWVGTMRIKSVNSSGRVEYGGYTQDQLEYELDVLRIWVGRIFILQVSVCPDGFTTPFL